MKLDGNTILITGGTSGIGRALAVALHERGNQVIISGRRQDLLDIVTKSHPGIVGMQLDLDDPSSLVRLGKDVRARFPELNVLIANAGISRPEDITADDWNIADAEAIIKTNIIGVLAVTAEFLPLLKEQSHATLVATSSALAFVPRVDFPTYCASKAFLHSWLVSVRHQLRNVPVEVLELLPPYVQTSLTGVQQLSDPRAMPLDTFVADVMNLLEHSDHPNGEILLDQDRIRRWAEREGTYNDIFNLMNPG